MRIGVIGGTGPAGRGIALRLASVGHDVVVGSRRVEHAVEVVAEQVAKHPTRELALRGGDNADAAAADVVVIATPWDAAAPTARAHADRLADKLVVCMANALVRVGTEFHALYPPRGSVAADVQAAVPAAHVVAAFQHLPARELAAIDHPLRSDVLVCTDRFDALDDVVHLVETIPGLRALDCGSLANAGPIEAFTAVLLQLNGRYRTRTSILVSGIDDEVPG